MSEQINRRDFIKRAAASGAGLSLAMSGASTGRVLGANDRIRLGLIGCGRQGRDNMGNFRRQKVEIAAVCDVYEPNLRKALREAAGGNGEDTERLSPSPR